MERPGPDEEDRAMQRLHGFEEILKEGGAEVNERGVLEVTPNQIEHAWREMMIDFDERKVEFLEEDSSEITESRTFTAAEIAATILAVENHTKSLGSLDISANDLIPIGQTRQRKGPIVALYYKLRRPRDASPNAPYVFYEYIIKGHHARALSQRKPGSTFLQPSVTGISSVICETDNIDDAYGGETLAEYINGRWIIRK
jgi:hypothetical protein